MTRGVKLETSEVEHNRLAGTLDALFFTFMDATHLARAEAITAYTVARTAQLSKQSSAQLAWLAARGILRHLRAPCWDEQICTNTGQRRSYCSPLGQVLGVGSQEYGQHCAAYPRTKTSQKAAEIVREAILEYLEGYFTRALANETFSEVNNQYEQSQL